MILGMLPKLAVRVALAPIPKADGKGGRVGLNMVTESTVGGTQYYIYIDITRIPNGRRGR